MIYETCIEIRVRWAVSSRVLEDASNIEYLLCFDGKPFVIVGGIDDGRMIRAAPVSG